MKTTLLSLAGSVLCSCLCFSAMCRAQTVDIEPISASFFSARFPSGWSHQSDEGGFTAKPRDDHHSQVLSVLACERASKNQNCVHVCSAADAKTNYFWFFVNNPNAIYSEFKRNGFTEYRATGKFGESDVWFAASVLCSDSGLVSVGSQSQMSAESIEQLDSFVKEVRWGK